MNELKHKSTEARALNIQDFYNIKIKSLWEGFWREHFSFWGLCSIYFLEYVRPQSMYRVLEVIPWSNVAYAITILGAIIDPSVKWVSSIHNKILGLFTIIIILSGIFAFNPNAAWINSGLFLNWLLAYFLMILILNTEKRYFIFVLLYLLFSFKMSQHGFFSWAGRGFTYTQWGLVGAAAWFRNSGEFAIQMIIFSSLAAGFIFALKEKWGPIKQWVFYMMPITAIFSIMGAGSRGSYLALGVIALWLLLIWKQRVKAITVIVAFGLLLFFILPETQISRFTSMGQDGTSLQRLAYWEFGMKTLGEHPLLGIGYFNWVDYLHYAMPEGIGVIDKMELPHNIFIQAGAELGYTGLIVFLLLVFAMLKTSAHTRRIARRLNNKFFFYISYGLDAGLIGYLVAGFFVSVLYYPFFWTQLGMVVALNAIAKNKLNMITENIKVDKGQLE